jgi:IS5 family transposase
MTPLPLIKRPKSRQQFGFQKTQLRGIAKNHCKINVLTVLTNLFMARRQLLLTS